jgi:laminin, alpha 1/2
MACDLGDGEPFKAETKFDSKFSLCDNKWHNISALYDTHQVAIRVDDQPFVVAYASSRIIGKLQTKSSLYIGGLPGEWNGTFISRFGSCVSLLVPLFKQMPDPKCFDVYCFYRHDVC